MERVTMIVKRNGFFDNGLTLIDKEGNDYIWPTSQRTHDLFVFPDYFKIRATIVRKNILKDVRVVRNEKL